MENVTAIVKTFLRDEYLEVCLKSLRETYPKIRILVADDGRLTHAKTAMVHRYANEYYKMPFDSGIPKGRNFLIDKVKTKYVLIGDDDFKYDPQTGVEKMVDTLEQRTDIDIVGGRVREKGEVKNYQGSFYDDPTHLRFVPITSDCVVTCDFVFNFFLARTRRIRDVGWDENIYVAYEHSDFFLSAKQHGLTVAYHPYVIVEHRPPVNLAHREEYATYRNRKSDKEYWFKKHGYDYVIDIHGYKDTL